ncbi:MAG TPA: hypothetical protein PLL30_06055 [Candidatus Krumholzibacteria bacterium]|nr:hypothetical protein [Candidatus Krumholzibacteria bacterium]HPD71328.1 hypothetical protein [Candidatus Krumholzibacteria bacterium]HRY38972.1 hypothetical protein [Candidatus Krumholzibacteria bacterium]
MTLAKQPPRPPSRRRSAGCQRRAWLVIALGLVAAIAGAEPPPGGAPLDSLVTAPVPVAGASLGLSRSVLPDVTTTTVPRQAAPSVPPRLDDPAAGERFFAAARHAAGTGRYDQAQRNIDAALAARPNDSRLPLWLIAQALRDRDPQALVWHLPGAWRAARADPLAAPRLAVLAHQAALLMLSVFWSCLVIAYLLAWWRPLAHDLSALIFRDATHRPRLWTPWLLVAGVLLARPGWLGCLALVSVPLLIQARGRARALLVGTWLVALGLSFPNLPPLRESVPILDPESETSLLVRASSEDASATLIQELRERLASTEDRGRQLRLRLGLGLQEARRGRYSASSEQFRAVLAQRSDDVVALVGAANNSYFLSRFDEALGDYRRARVLDPLRGEIPFNMAQVYFKKLFVPEAGQALDDARARGFDPAVAQGAVPAAQEFSAVVYLPIEKEDLRASARSEAMRYQPLAGLAAWNYFLGAPPLPLFVLLGGLFAIALLLAYWSGIQDDIHRCGNCGTEICRGCCTERDGAWLCRECADTANRSRSDMVMGTLLKNRSRAVGLASTSRLVLLARLLPGAAHLALGETARALGRLALVAVAVFLVAFAWAFDPSTTWSSPGLVLAEESVHPLWLPLPAASWPGWLGWPVALGWVLLAIAYMIGITDGARLRLQLPERFVQYHTPIPGPGRT